MTLLTIGLVIFGIIFLIAIVASIISNPFILVVGFALCAIFGGITEIIGITIWPGIIFGIICTIGTIFSRQYITWGKMDDINDSINRRNKW
jgi:hypothetical protein